MLNYLKTKKDQDFEKDVKHIHELLGTPLELIRAYLVHADGKRETAIDMILNNSELPKESVKSTLDKEVATLEDELIRLEAKIQSTKKHTNDPKDLVDLEKSFIERQILEAKESKNIHFFCKGEEDALMDKAIKRWLIKPVNSFDLEAEQIHFRIAESQFHRFLAAFGQSGVYRLENVEYIINPQIVKTFNAAKFKLAKRHGMLPESMKPVLLFHGTSDANMENIIKTNFLISKVGSTTDMGWYGKGIYFSEFPGTSISYSRGNPFLLLCLVFVGKAFKMTQVQTGCALTEGYDSHIDASGSEVVIFDCDCILPCYKVKWVQTGNQQLNVDAYAQEY